MKIESLELTDFRNYSSCSIAFEPGINIITGINGAGKTNIAEAIHYLSLGKSFRTNDEKEMIRFREEFARIEMNVLKKEKMNLKAVISREGKKIFFNGIELKKLSELTGKLNVVLFTPEDVLFFKDSPAVRRKFFDIHLSEMNPDYLRNLTLYRNLLRERNALLKEDSVDRTYLQCLNEKMIEPQFEILIHRQNMVKKINEILTSSYHQLDEEKVTLKLFYQKASQKTDLESFRQEMLQTYENEFETDAKRKSTGTGIHHDDYRMYRDGREIEAFGSQGQNRLAALALKLSVFELLKEATGEEPVIILDDVLSELDRTHQDRLLECLHQYDQVFITCAKEDEKIENAAHYAVEDNQVTRR